MPTGGLAHWLVPLLWRTVGSYALNTITNKLFGPKPPDKKFNQLQTQCNSSLAIPMVYGKVKLGGNIIWNNPGTSSTARRIVSFGEGPVKGITQVLFNDLLVEDGPVFKLQNTLYSDAAVTVQTRGGSTAKDKTLILYANGQTTEITLCSTVDVGKNGMLDYNGYVKKLISYIADLGNGWDIVDPVPSSNKCESINSFGEIACYNSPVSFNVEGLEGCSYDVYVGDGEQLIDSRVTGDTQEEKAKEIGGLKYDAYVALTAKASDKLSSSFNVTAVVEGRLVRIYDTLTTYHIAWSDNPAWCILDYLMAYNGCGLTEDAIDIQTFIDAAAYCDELVNGQKRFTLNISLGEKKSRLDWLIDMLFCCRAYPFYQRGKHGIIIEKPESIAQVFNIAKDEEFETWGSELNEILDKAILKYCDPDYEWTTVGSQAKAKTVLRFPLVEKTIEAEGITNFQQASMLAWFYLNQSIICAQHARYKCNRRAINRTIGDVVQITDPVLNVTNKWRIFEMTEPQDGKIEMKLRLYDERLYTDELGGLQPTVMAPAAQNPAAKPPEVSGIVLTQNYYRLRDATIVSDIIGTCTLPDYVNFSSAGVEWSNDNGTTWHNAGITNPDGGFVIHNAVTGLNYLIRIRVKSRGFGIISDGVISDPIYITGKDAPPSDVTSLTVAQDLTDCTKLIIVCDPVTDIDFKALDIKINDVQVEPVYGFRYVYTLEKSGQYTVRVRALDWSNNPSTNEAVYSLDVKIEPSDVTGFRVVQNGGTALFSWPKRPEADAVGVEIREGPTFDYGSLIVTGYAETLYQTPVSTEGLHRYHIKAINRAGKYSKNAVSFTVNISNLPDRNIILSYDEIELQNGAHDNTQFGISAINCLTLPGKCSDYAGIKCNQIGGHNVLKLKGFEYFGSPFMPVIDTYLSNGKYIVQRKDVGKVITANIASQFSSNTLIDESVSARLQYRTSVDGINFTEWQDFIPVTATFQYVDFAVDLSTQNYRKSPEVSLLKEELDLDDTPKSGMATIPIGGDYIEYGFEYHDIRTFQSTAIGEGLYTDLVSVDNLRAFVKVKCITDNVDVGGPVTWSSNGI